jgi:hypothetical protein
LPDFASRLGTLAQETGLKDLGEVAEGEMIAEGDFFDEAFDAAAARAVRMAGMTEAEVADMLMNVSLPTENKFVRVSGAMLPHVTASGKVRFLLKGLKQVRRDDAARIRPKAKTTKDCFQTAATRSQQSLPKPIASSPASPSRLSRGRSGGKSTFSERSIPLIPSPSLP